MQTTRCILAGVALALLSLLLTACPAQAQGGLTTVDTPQGGRIVYGQVMGETTEAGAMGTVLRNIHQHVGDRPKVSRLFQVRGTQSVAAFFSVDNRNAHAGPLKGLLIVTKVATDNVQAALITDSAARFAADYNSSMKKLFEIWHPFAAGRAASSGGGSEADESAADASPSAGASAPAMPLRRVVLPDQSAAVGVPAGWRVDPASAGGTLTVNGPNGEVAVLNSTLLVMDLNNPQARQNYATVMRGGLPNSTYSEACYYPYGGDPAKTFVDLVNLSRRKNRVPTARFQIANIVRIAGSAGNCFHLTGQMDGGDGAGVQEMNSAYVLDRPDQYGTYLASFYITLVPARLADRERATMAAILASFRSNNAVIQAQADAIAGPVVARIKEVGRVATANYNAAQERNAIQNSSVYRRWDSQDKRSQELSNYQLGYSAVQDNDNNTRGTVWNADADALVSQNPQRFEYVEAPDFWKGVDY